MSHPPTSASPLTLAKRALRQEMEQKRQTAAAQHLDAATALRDLLLRHFSFPSHSVIAGYYRRGSEIDPSPVMDILRDAGHKIALPVIQAKKAPLLFRQYNAGDRLKPGYFGTYEPTDEAPLLEPDIILAPLLAFDRQMGRLGYGGGYYDRTLNGLRQRKKLLAIGLAYSCQEVPLIPISSFDARLDKVATECEVIGTG